MTQANRNITCSYLNVLNCIEKYVNDEDRNRAKQHVWNSIDPQQMLDRGMIHLDTFLYCLDTDRFEYMPSVTYHYLSLPIVHPRMNF